MKKYKKVVLKIGSALISETNVSSSHLVNNLTNQISNADKDIQFIIVSSGAISQGMKILNIDNKPIDLESLQALAAIGQQKLMGLYEKFVEGELPGIIVGAATRARLVNQFLRHIMRKVL